MRRIGGLLLFVADLARAARDPLNLLASFPQISLGKSDRLHSLPSSVRPWGMSCKADRMSTHRAHQKRLEKKKRDRELAKRHARVRAQEASFPTSATGMARRAEKCPFGLALMSPAWREDEGASAVPSLVHVVVTRALPSGDVALAAILVDRTCLGVKDAMVRGPLGPADVRRVLDRLAGPHGAPLEEVSVREAQSVVLHALAFARSLGFDPHPDFASARIVLGVPETPLLDTPLCRPSRPVYVDGPRDDVARITAQLERVAPSAWKHHDSFEAESDPALDDALDAVGEDEAALIAFAEPLLEATDGSAEQVRKALDVAMMFWSLATIEKDAERARLLEAIASTSFDSPEAKDHFRSAANEMVERHRTMFT